MEQDFKIMEQEIEASLIQFNILKLVHKSLTNW